jgi:antitoxin ParD1/3/4
METLNVALPACLIEFVQQRVVEGGYGSVSEYLRELIQLDWSRQTQPKLEAELLRGLGSGPPEPMTNSEWAEIRDTVRRRGTTC